MNYKGYIQTQIEDMRNKGLFAKQLQGIVEKYNVKDTVFGRFGSECRELASGYFVATKTFESLQDAIRQMNGSQAIRIVENDTFIVGDVYSSLCECEDCEHVFNIEFLEDVH